MTKLRERGSVSIENVLLVLLIVVIAIPTVGRMSHVMNKATCDYIILSKHGADELMMRQYRLGAIGYRPTPAGGDKEWVCCEDWNACRRYPNRAVFTVTYPG